MKFCNSDTLKMWYICRMYDIPIQSSERCIKVTILGLGWTQSIGYNFFSLLYWKGLKNSNNFFKFPDYFLIHFISFFSLSLFLFSLSRPSHYLSSQSHFSFSLYLFFSIHLVSFSLSLFSPSLHTFQFLYFSLFHSPFIFPHFFEVGTKSSLFLTLCTQSFLFTSIQYAQEQN